RIQLLRAAQPEFIVSSTCSSVDTQCQHRKRNRASRLKSTSKEGFSQVKDCNDCRPWRPHRLLPETERRVRITWYLLAFFLLESTVVCYCYSVLVRIFQVKGTS